MVILVCLGNQILSAGVKRILSENLPESHVMVCESGWQSDEPDIILFDSRQDIDQLKGIYLHSKFICIDLGLKDAELACLFLCHEINGIISPKLTIEMFCKALQKVYEGEIWLEQSHVKALLSTERKKVSKDDFHGFSQQDKQMIKLLVEGLHNQEIADQLYLSVPTIKAHLCRIYKSLGVKNRSQLVALAKDSSW